MAGRTEKIIDRVMAMKDAINQPGAAGIDAAEANTKLAIDAVTGGIKSTAWETYMKQFVSNDDQEQLNRLLAIDGTDDEQDLIDNRAYLVANGVCGQGTKGRFDENVRSIDRILETNCKAKNEP